MVYAVFNGGFREVILIRKIGEKKAHILSTVILAASIAFVTWLTLPWIGPKTSQEAWELGALWLGLTLIFEFLAGHYLFHRSWAELLTEYNVFHGRIWIIVLLVTFLAPILVFPIRH